MALVQMPQWREVVLVVVQVLVWRKQQRAAPGAGQLAASHVHAQLVLGDEGGGEEQGEEGKSGHGNMAMREEGREERGGKGEWREHQGYQWSCWRPH